MQHGPIDTVTLTFELLTSKAYNLEYVPRSLLFPVGCQVCTLWDHSFLSYNAADKQTNKQTITNVLPTPTDIVGVGKSLSVKVDFGSFSYLVKIGVNVNHKIKM